jgi:hypothetical protein
MIIVPSGIKPDISRIQVKYYCLSRLDRCVYFCIIFMHLRIWR